MRRHSNTKTDTFSANRFSLYFPEKTESHLDRKTINFQGVKRHGQPVLLCFHMHWEGYAENGQIRNLKLVMYKVGKFHADWEILYNMYVIQQKRGACTRVLNSGFIHDSCCALALMAQCYTHLLEDDTRQQRRWAVAGLWTVTVDVVWEWAIQNFYFTKFRCRMVYYR